MDGAERSLIRKDNMPLVSDVIAELLKLPPNSDVFFDVECTSSSCWIWPTFKRAVGPRQPGHMSKIEMEWNGLPPPGAVKKDAQVVSAQDQHASEEKKIVVKRDLTKPEVKIYCMKCTRGYDDRGKQCKECGGKGYITAGEVQKKRDAAREKLMEKFETALNAVSESGLVKQCPKCLGVGCQDCDHKGVVKL